MSSQTIITQNIDGIEVVKGFGKLAIDPVETKQVVAVSIQTTPEFLAVKEKQDKCNDAMRDAGEENVKMKAAVNGSAARSTAWRACKTHREIALSFEKETRDALPALKKKRQELMTEQAVYFEPKLGEYAKTDAEIQALRDVLASVQGSGYVDLDGKILEDNRGAVYCVLKSDKWSVSKIMSIGVKIPATSILYGDLDADQKKAVDLHLEKSAAAVMSAGEKLQAKEAAEARAIADAGNLDRSLQIQGSTAEDALTEAQNWLANREAEIVLIYG